MHGPEDSRHQTTTRRQAVDRWDACTTHAASRPVGLSQTQDRPARAGCNETQDPKLRTMDTPTCPASRSRPRCTDVSTRCFYLWLVLREVLALPDPRSTNPQLRSDRTAWTTTDRLKTVALPPARLMNAQWELFFGRTHLRHEFVH